MTQADRLSEAVDAMEERLESVSGFMRGLEGREGVDAEALGKAIHDTANVQQSLGALRRIVRRLAEAQGA